MNEHSTRMPNQRLREARLRRHWSQQELAAQIGTTIVNVSRWERGITYPGPHFRHQLCALFGTSAQELGLFPGITASLAEQPTSQDDRQQARETPSEAASSLWSLPYRRNPLFTGREDILLRLRQTLDIRRAAALTQAISGLGGIGKTQTALEYGYRFRHDYAAVLWARAETQDVLLADVLAIADLLHLPEAGDLDSQRVIAAVKRWLKDTSGWLLILDNVEDFTLVSDFLPAESTGHVLLTTRAQSTGVLAQRIDLDKMELDEGALLLLRRAKLIEPDAQLAAASQSDLLLAREATRLLDGLPLALDQAGAYIEETGCSIGDYLACYQGRRADLLNLRGHFGIDHPQSVAATLSLSFEKVAHAHPAAAELLRLCAFLHPDVIPTEMLIEAAPCLGPLLQPVVSDPLQFDSALAALRTYSLLRRNAATKTLTIHRLVQAVLKDNMDRDTQRVWAEKAVRAINCALPMEPGNLAMWPRFQRYLPHALVCVSLIDEWSIQLPQAARLLRSTGAYLMKSGQYHQVEQFFFKARDIAVQTLGAQDSEVAKILSSLAELYFYQGHYTQAELLNRQALAIEEQALGPQHPSVGNMLNDLAVAFHAQDKYSEAEPLYRRALAIRRQALGEEHVDVAESLNNLAYFYFSQRDYAQAEPHYQQALAIYAKVVGSESVEVARSLNNLATLYRTLGQYTQAEALNTRALTLYEKCLGPEHREVAFCLNNLANTYHAQGKFEQAEALFRRALALREKVLGPENPDVANSLQSLARHYFEQGKYNEALPFYQKALTIREQALGPDNALTAQTLHDLATLLTKQSQFDQAEALYRRALAIREKTFGSSHPNAVSTLQALADLLSQTSREAEAAALRGRTREEHTI